ncbi:MAG TPA: D-alanyl-D-alanine carboxypeptidase family protein [Accumulibacter sp.]|uniref:D-alanyl-D-alanine carboxypeptidase family protein n=1 Tax=Accumulibacter sp. TaxID=2053492 RepID=UPI002610106F|nr:D-alanyl-D-alanine carboxypeptidase family protein [Accumulibacter sp.]MDS4056804.1 D-alanyl-D-alanine carboxypeptidase family protein [Accumulibacter sp.]HMV05018.1 D-alanyl-D-alanine carboxypeptidase family protein [Accumulibacter sp.]HMW62611.1 D-alanyl-D-alanine carboxypeptidase family protein [Accumulibacter sp.]HMW80654.1 D-alanyl-D-alanine carboxypeptidase family protein [Accumulibacter sp.]HMX69400.1 D-alanyl-D-alanine carboxypeptidase family protein [Accumulibacter sp.]
MRRFRSVVFLLLCLPALVFAQQLPIPPVLAAKSWLLIEAASGQELAAQAADQRLEPASLTKLMTAYLSFAALRQGTIKLDQAVPVSQKAWKTGGSRMFIQIGTEVRIEDLLKGMIVQSGNDACVALAEAIAGDEENFAQLMNREAQRLGMKASSFRNASGLPDPQHYTTARDLALLAGALIRDFPEEYAKYYSLKEFRYNKITQPNRNRLLWLDPTVDGLKTGHTEGAGYCLVSSAKRGARRLLAVVLGTASDNQRAQESLKLLNYGFQFYDAVQLYARNEPVSSLKVWKGKENAVKLGFAHDLVLAVPKGYGSRLRTELVSQQPLLAPITRGQVLGTLKVSMDGKPYGEYPVSALEAVEPAGIVGRAFDGIRLWLN